MKKQANVSSIAPGGAASARSTAEKLGKYMSMESGATAVNTPNITSQRENFMGGVSGGKMFTMRYPLVEGLS